MRLCDYCLGRMAVLPVLEIGEFVFCDADCAERHIQQGKAAFATANQRIAELEAQLAAAKTGEGCSHGRDRPSQCVDCIQERA